MPALKAISRPENVADLELFRVLLHADKIVCTIRGQDFNICGFSFALTKLPTSFRIKLVITNCKGKHATY